jgi:hypothetical protein
MDDLCYLCYALGVYVRQLVTGVRYNPRSSVYMGTHILMVGNGADNSLVVCKGLCDVCKSAQRVKRLHEHCEGCMDVAKNVQRTQSEFQRVSER